MSEHNTRDRQGEALDFAQAITTANIPTLLMVLVQFTGELHWLEEPYRLSRARGLGDNDTGGLSAELQKEIRQAALEAILAWRAGKPVVIPEPASELRLKMLSWAMAEKVPAEYDPIIEAELAASSDNGNNGTHKLPVPDGYQVLIIGAGVSGSNARVSQT